MGIPNVIINYWVVLIAAVVSYIIGALWYSPLLFGKIWLKEMKFSKKDIEKAKKKGMLKLYLINFIGTLIMVYVLAHFVIYTTAMTLSDGLQLGFWLWLGFFATTTLLGSVLWEGKSIKLYLINGGYWLVNLLIASSILSVWR